MLQACSNVSRMLLRMLRGCLMNASNMHQEYFQDANPYDCSLSQSPNEGFVVLLSSVSLGGRI